MKRPLRSQYPGAAYHITWRGNARQECISHNPESIAMKSLLLLMLITIVSMIINVSITEAIQYDWNGDDEGFVSFQDPWSHADSSWGGAVGGGSYSARMVGITGLGNTDAISEFNSFIDTILSPENDLAVSIDVFKASNSGWKAPTGQQLSPFNDAFDNTHSSLVMVWLSDGAFQYSFGAELDGADGWEYNIQLDYLGFRVLPRHPFTHELLMKSELEVRLQTYRGDSNGVASYKIDGLSITSHSVVPEPVSAILFVTGGIFLAGKRYMKRMKT